MKGKNMVKKFFDYIIYLTIIVIVIYPLLFMIQTAFKTPIELTRNFWLPPSIKGFTLKNLYDVWFGYKFYIFFINSIIVSSVSTFTVVILSITSGYAFAKLKFPFSEKVFFVILSVMFLPVFIYIIPLFVQMSRMRLTNTLTSLIVVNIYFGLPVSIYIARNFFYSIPYELNEAALIDGANQVQVFTKIILPLSKPAISCIAILTFLGTWGEYIWATISNTKDNVKTIPVALSYFTSMSNVFWWYQMAALFITIVPVITIYLIFNKLFIRGFAEGAVKG